VKEALLFAVGSLTEIIRLYSDMATSIEPMLKAHVLPDLASSHLLLRSRACWVYGEFSDFDIEET